MKISLEIFNHNDTQTCKNPIKPTVMALDNYKYNGELLCPELYKSGDPEILKTYMSKFIRHFNKNDHFCYFWAFKIIELSNPKQPDRQRKKQSPRQYDPTDNLTAVGIGRDSDTSLLSHREKLDLIYTAKGSSNYKGPFGGTTTYHGFSVGDLKSCLQKYIRRGETNKAVRVLLELDRLYLYERSVNKPCGLRTNMINRLRIMACEDFADGNIEMIELCDKYIREWTSYRDTDYIKGTKALVRLAKVLEQVTKSRMISFIRATYQTGLSFNTIKQKYGVIYGDLPNLTADLIDIPKNLPKMKCSRRFKKTKCEYIIWEFLLNHCNLADNVKRVVAINLEWFKTSSQKEYWIYLFNSIKICLGETDYSSQPSINDPDISDGDIENMLLSHLTTTFILDDYCFDQHTKRGRQAGRSHIYFSKIGSKVLNESPNVIKIYKDIYQDIKILAETGDLPLNPVPIDHLHQWSHMQKPHRSRPIRPKIIKIRRKKPKNVARDHSVIKVKNILELLDYYTFTELTKEEYHTIIKLPQGQKLTSSSKKSVFIGSENVYKGPFHLNGKKLVNNIKFTIGLKLLEEVANIPIKKQSLLNFNIKHLSGYYYLVYKNIAKILPEDRLDTVSTRVISKSAKLLACELGETPPGEIVSIYPRGIINRISDIIKLHPTKFTDEIKIATLQHLYFRYLLNVGDSGVHNILYREDGSSKLIAGIDMEEIRTKDQGTTKITYLFNSAGFNKTVQRFKSHVADISVISKDSLIPIIGRLQELGFDIDNIKHKIDKFNCATDVP